MEFTTHFVSKLFFKYFGDFPNHDKNVNTLLDFIYLDLILTIIVYFSSDSLQENSTQQSGFNLKIYNIFISTKLKY